MAIETIRSYLVSLGFDVSSPELAKFEGALKTAGSAVEANTVSIAKSLVTWQTAIIGGFAAVGAAALGLADNVAMADQRWRLMGLHMLLNQDAAKSLDISMKALGATMAEIAWDPELHARFLQLQADQATYQKELGGSFEGQMRAIRDLRFELTRLQVGLQYLGMALISSLFGKFGLTIEDVQKKLESVNVWFQQNLPGIAESLSTILLPVLRDAWEVIQALGPAFREAGVAFLNLVGFVSNDQSIQGTTITFQKFGQAIQDASHFLRDISIAITEAFTAVMHLISGLALLASGNWRGANAEGNAMADSAKQAFDRLAGWYRAGDQESTGIVRAGRFGPGDTGTAAATAGSSSAMQAYSQAVRVGSLLNIDPKLIFEQWANESNNFKSPVFARTGNAAGIRLPGSTEYQQFGSFSEFADRYAQVLQLNRYRGLGSAMNEEQFSSILKAGGYFEGAQPAYAARMQQFGGEYAQLKGANIRLGDVTVNVATNSDAKQIGVEVAKAQKRQIQLDMAQLSPG